MSRERLLIFAKSPRLGAVKTRLAAEIGAEAALKVYRDLLAALGRNLKEEPATVCCDPADGAAELQLLLPKHWSIRPQIGADLGERLFNAARDAFAAGAEKTVIIGSDCPFVTAADIREAFALLDQHDLVLGPALDGGYWLIGLRRAEAQLFRGIHWSSSAVLRETLRKAEDLKLSVRQLRPLCDIDTAADLEYWRALSAGSPAGSGS